VTDAGVMRVITRLNIGGPARQAILLSHALVARGYAPHLVWGTVAADEGELTLPREIPNTHLALLRRELRPADDVRALWELRRLMRERRPQIVHTHMAKAGALGRLATRRTGVPVVIHTFHGHVLEGYFPGWKSRAFLATERGLARISDALVAVSPAIRDELLDLGIGRPDQWRVIPVGLDLHDLLTLDVDRVRARQALGLPQTGSVVGIVGRLVPIKDHVTFLDAAARIAHDRSDVTFVVVGGGELRSELEVRARHLLGDRCRFLGWVMDLTTLYAALDLVVLASRNEGTPVALIEAGAAGKPVVATRVGGVADVVQDGKTGLLVPPGDPAAVAAGISALLDDPARARALGEAARGEANARFTIERLADDLTRLYGELLARKASGLERDRPSRR
jgi:glycosyltransferase involved in cell wall biosynthesis